MEGGFFTLVESLACGGSPVNVTILLLMLLEDKYLRLLNKGRVYLLKIATIVRIIRAHTAVVGKHIIRHQRGLDKKVVG